MPRRCIRTASCRTRFLSKIFSRCVRQLRKAVSLFLGLGIQRWTTAGRCCLLRHTNEQVLTRRLNLFAMEVWNLKKNMYHAVFWISLFIKNVCAPAAQFETKTWERLFSVQLIGLNGEQNNTKKHIHHLYGSKELLTQNLSPCPQRSRKLKNKLGREAKK